MKASQLSLFEPVHPAADVAQDSFLPTHEAFTGPARWSHQDRGDERPLERTFRRRSRQEWANVRAELARREEVAPAPSPSPSIESPRTKEPGDTGAIPEGPLPVTAFDNESKSALGTEIRPLDVVQADGCAAGVVFSVSPELLQAAVVIPPGHITVAALTELRCPQPAPELPGLRERVRALRLRLGLDEQLRSLNEQSRHP